MRVDEKGLQAKTRESHLSAVKRYHGVSRGFELQATHPLLVTLLKGVIRSRVESGNPQQRLRRLLLTS